jgi:hypothetical protein
MWQQTDMRKTAERDELSALGLTFAQAHEQALGNLVKLDRESAPPFKKQIRPVGKHHLLAWHGHWLAASCIRLPYLHKWAQAQLHADEICVSIPQEQLMFMYPKADAAFRAEVQEFTGPIVEGMDRRITDAVFLLTAGGLAEFAEA